jgi:hypothetical protein
MRLSRSSALPAWLFTESLHTLRTGLPWDHEPGRAALPRRPNMKKNGGAATPPYQEAIHGELAMGCLRSTRTRLSAR